MPGKKPAEAAAAFLDPLQRVVSCITEQPLVASPRGRHVTDTPHTLTFAGDTIPVGKVGWRLRLRMQYMIVKHPKQWLGKWKVRTLQYNYVFLGADGAKILLYHWHPEGRSHVKTPHLHTHARDERFSHKWHLPTGRISIEEVVRFCITDLDTKVCRSDWQEVIVTAERNFRDYRSWH